MKTSIYNALKDLGWSDQCSELYSIHLSSFCDEHKIEDLTFVRYTNNDFDSLVEFEDQNKKPVWLKTSPFRYSITQPKD